MVDNNQIAINMQALYPDNPLKRFLFRAPLLTWRLGLGPLTGKLFLLLTTYGRKSGKPRHTLVEYYQVGTSKYAMCAFGSRADWYKNIQADSRVTIQTSDGTQTALAERVSNPEELWQVLQVFMRRDPPLTKWYLDSLGLKMDPEIQNTHIDDIYLIRFRTNSVIAPAGQEVDLAWYWPLLAMLSLISSIWLWRKKSKKSS